jgi:transcription initiation factor TFIIB
MDMVYEEWNTHDKCPECNGNVIIVKERGERTCCQCGLIVNEREFPYIYIEKSKFSAEVKLNSSRNGPMISSLTPDISLCTLIEKNQIYNSDLKRAVKRDTYLSWEKKNLLIAITELRRICYNLSLPDHIVKEAFKLYKKAYKRNLVKGRTIVGIVAACIYCICKKESISRAFQEILDESTADQKSLKNCIKILAKAFKLKISLSNPVNLIPQFIAELGLSFEVEKLTIKVLESYLRKGLLNGKNPKGLCGGAIYLVAKIKNLRINQKRIGEVVGVTEVTLRSQYKSLLNTLDFTYM